MASEGNATMAQIRSKDGTAISTYHWPAEGKARAQVLIVHGYGEHAQRYDELARRLAAAGYDVLADDHRGHGTSGGVRSHVERFSEYLDDLEIVLAEADRLVPGLPRYVIGHSLGGLIALRYAIERRPSWAGLVLSSPFLRVKLQVPQWKVLAGQVASRIYPRLALPSGLSGAAVARDPDIARLYDTDPLNGRAATARWYTEALLAQDHVFAEADRVTMPVLLLHGEADVVADPARSAELFPRLGSSDKTLELITGAYHEIFNDPPAERAKIMARVVSWLDQHIA